MILDMLLENIPNKKIKTHVFYHCLGHIIGTDNSVHVFLASKDLIEEIKEKIRDIFKELGMEKRYVFGVEKITLDEEVEANNIVGIYAYLNNEKFDKVLNKEVIKLISVEKRKTIKLDIDLYKSYIKDIDNINVFINEINKYGNKAKSYRSARGFHIRIPLEKPLEFKELIDIRKKMLDDPHRIIYDVMWYSLFNNEALTNILFNEKHVDGKKVHDEKEISLQEVLDVINKLREILSRKRKKPYTPKSSNIKCKEILDRNIVMVIDKNINKRINEEYVILNYEIKAKVMVNSKIYDIEVLITIDPETRYYCDEEEAIMFSYYIKIENEGNILVETEDEYTFTGGIDYKIVEEMVEQVKELNAELVPVICAISDTIDKLLDEGDSWALQELSDCMFEDDEESY